MVNENKHIINRKIMLVEHGDTVRTLANAINYTTQAVNEAIIGRSTSYRCQSRIAAYYKRPMVEIWPELYAVVPDVDPVKATISHDSKVNENVNSVN